VGDIITIVGSGFQADRDITIRIDGTPIYAYQTGWDGRMQVMSGPSGAFGNPSGGLTGSGLTPSVRFTIPTLVGGMHIVSADDGLANEAETTITVLSKILVSPLRGLPGSHARVYGNGLQHEEPLAIAWNGSIFENTPQEVDAGGLFDYTVKIPDAHKGVFQITVINGSSTETFDFIVDGPAAPAPHLVCPASGSHLSQVSVFSWSPVDDPSAITYQFQLGADPDLQVVLVDKPRITGLGCQLTKAEEEAMKQLAQRSVLYWRVRVVDGIGQAGAWSSVNRFEIIPPLQTWRVFAIGLGILVVCSIAFLIYHRLAVSRRSSI
jgi:hypothetical protein